MSSRLPRKWGFPHALLVGLVITIIASVVFIGFSSTTAFGVYNSGWDGSAGIRSVAADAGVDTTVATSTSEYPQQQTNDIGIILSPDSSYTAAELAEVRAFVRGGGTLLVAEDFGANGNRVLRGVNSTIRVTGVPLRDEQSYYRSPALPVAQNVTEHPSTQGVDQLTLNHASTLTSSTDQELGSSNATNRTVLVRSSEFSYVDTNRNETLDPSEATGPRPVVAIESVGEGTVVVISDPSLFINAMLDRPGNERFVSNLIVDTDSVLLDYSHHGSQPPLAAALLWLRRTPLAVALIGLIALGMIGWWSRREETTTLLDETETNSMNTSRHMGMDEQAMESYLRERYPDWDDSQLRRVMTAVFARRDSGDTNE